MMVTSVKDCNKFSKSDLINALFRNVISMSLKIKRLKSIKIPYFKDELNKDESL